MTMNVITKIEHWGDTHRLSWFVIFRIALGVFITFKGIHFVNNLDQLREMSMNLAYMSAMAAHYVMFAHLLGGPLIFLGYYTRTACLIQVPVLIGAVIFVNFPSGFMSVGNYFELEISILVLLALIFFSIFGAGKYSLDEKRRHDEEMMKGRPKNMNDLK
tara:strand:+ start:1145 stop:1624 length:480 start_codon:yes stop_codon:yes gene_type:complete